MAEDGGEAGSTEKTFTQAEVDKIVRERLNRERDKFKDYDDLKSRAADADKNKSDMEKLLEKVSGLEKRATESDARALRAEVAQAKGLTPAQARRLQGSTKEELEADADELRESFKPASKDGDGGDGKTSATGGTEQQGGRGRPREALRSGAPVPQGGEEETDPMKLAAKIPRL